MNDQPPASDFVQAKRVLRVHSPLGENALLPERARITEGINQLFEIEVAVRSKQDIKPDEIIGKSVDVELEVAQGEDGEHAIYRPFNGLVTELHEGPAVTRGLRSYTLILRPSLWLLSQTRDSRIWMDRSTLDVLDTLMSEHGLRRADTAGVVIPVPPIIELRMYAYCFVQKIFSSFSHFNNMARLCMRLCVFRLPRSSR